MSLGLREYARHRKAAGLVGGTLKAVQEAIASGRLSSSLTEDGKRIRSATLADAEWTKNTRAHVAQSPGPDRSEYFGHRSRREASAADRERIDTELAAIKLAERRRELVPAKAVEQQWVTMITQCRNRLLAIPSKLGQRGVARDVAHLVDEEIRIALEDLASGRDLGTAPEVSS